MCFAIMLTPYQYYVLTCRTDHKVDINNDNKEDILINANAIAK